ncbi:MAG: hypothetical protein OSA42_06180 [Porticoccaceae bacterium]|nr:hypothetical protein [Porticoccaceae bacterium]
MLLLAVLPVLEAVEPPTPEVFLAFQAYSKNLVNFNAKAIVESDFQADARRNAEHVAVSGVRTIETHYATVVTK